MLFSSKINREKLMSSNESCFDFIVIENQEYLVSMENWKQLNPKINIESRNLSISNFNLTDV